MSQTAIPLEFEQYLQNKVSLGQPTDLNEIVFALIPDLDVSQPIDRSVTLPPQGQWVYQQAIDQIGRANRNAVVYSVVIPGSVEPFTFNAMFLRDRQVPKSCAMVVYKATETKEVGMALTKSMLMQFDGAAEAACVTVDAKTWQIDFAARLRGMDEDHRHHCLDDYGHTAFVEGLGVSRHEVDQTKYWLAPGVAYIGGLRIQSMAPLAMTVADRPSTVWLDVTREGTALSAHENVYRVVTGTEARVDYVDEDGCPHYVAKVATIHADGSVSDERVRGGLSGHLAAGDPHSQYYRKGDQLTLESDDSGYPRIVARKGGNPRWAIYMGDGAPELGGNTGSNLSFDSFGDDGQLLHPSVLSVSRDGVLKIKHEGASSGPFSWVPLPDGKILLVFECQYRGLDGPAGTPITLPFTFPHRIINAVCCDMGSGAHSTAVAIESNNRVRLWGRYPVDGSFRDTGIRLCLLGE